MFITWGDIHGTYMLELWWKNYHRERRERERERERERFSKSLQWLRWSSSSLDTHHPFFPEPSLFCVHIFRSKGTRPSLWSAYYQTHKKREIQLKFAKWDSNFFEENSSFSSSPSKLLESRRLQIDHGHQSSKMRWRRTVTYLGFLVVFFRLLLCRLLGLFSIHHLRSNKLHITSSTHTWAKEIKNSHPVFSQFYAALTTESLQWFVHDQPNTDIHTAYGGSGL